MLLESSALKWRISQTQFIYLERISIFLDLDCPASVWLSSLGLRPRLDNCQTLAGQSRSRKMKISLSANELRLSDSPLLSNYFPAAWNYDHRTFFCSKSQFFLKFNSREVFLCLLLTYFQYKNLSMIPIVFKGWFDLTLKFYSKIES